MMEFGGLFFILHKSVDCQVYWQYAPSVVKQFSMILKCHNHFSPPEGHLGSFQLLAITVKTCRGFSVNLIYISGINVQERSCCVIWQVQVYFQRECYLFRNDCAIPHSHQQSVNDTVFASSPAFNPVIFYISHFDQYVVIFHCGFNLHFLNG